MVEKSICSHCAQLGKTCCQETEIYLTIDDIKRIADFTSQRDFYEYRAPTDPSYLSQEDDPVWASQTIRSDGSRRVLKHITNLDCYFLTSNGCRLPMTIRPLVCRIHPYTYTIEGLSDAVDQRCRRTHLGSNQDLPKALGMSEDLAKTWHRQLYREILINEGIENNENWHNLRPAI
jgi:Fe-S-cluster containining protein